LFSGYKLIPSNCTQADQKSRAWVLFNLKTIVSVFSAAYCGVRREKNNTSQETIQWDGDMCE